MTQYKQTYYNYKEINYKKLKSNPNQINERYKYFNQTHYTAGDVDQFYKKIVDTNEHIDNTFKYLYHKFKKGIYIRIEKGKLKTFLPFSKNVFVNEWSYKLNMTKEEIKQIMNKANKNYNYSRFDDNPEKWFANNCLIRNEYPIREGEGGICEMKDMFEELCKNRKIKDVSFFVNRRDFPLLRKDRTEAYECIYGENEPLLSHNYEKYTPILSMNSNKNFEDISIPTWEDWDRVSYKHNKFFAKEFREYKDNFDIYWKDKKNIAVFRGQANGRGIDENTNMRLKISKMAYDYLDAGITKINMRPRFINGKIKVIDDNKYTTIKPLTPKEQSEYKYIINIEGHSVAYRLSYELSMRSVILLVNCKYKLWYSYMLKEYVHYIPIKEDLSDLIEKIEWCRNNDEKCEKIAKNAREFYDEYLNENGIYDNLEKVLNNIEIEEIEPFYKNFNSNYSRMLKKNEIEILGDKIESHKNISIYRYEGKEFIVKSGNILHEAFISIKGLNNLDNFVNIYGINSDCVIMEKVKGIRFDKWIRERFNWNEYIYILKRIFEALIQAEDKCEFIHYDLAPWNIIIKEGNIPIIIDFGKSKIKYRGRYYYIYNHSNNIVDIKSILFKSINIILEKFITDIEVIKDIINLMGLFYNFKSIYQIKRFLKIRTNYDHIVFGDENKYNIKIENLIKYIEKNISSKS